MKKNVFMLSLAAGLMLMSGCASKKSLQNCQLENQNLSSQYAKVKEELSDTKADLAAAKTRVQLLTDQLAQQKELMAQQKKNQEALQKSLDKSLLNAGSNNVNISKLVDQINESNQYIRHLVNVKSKSDSLNVVLTNNLTRSLSKEELKEVDVQVLKGVVYISLADNMLYKSGSYEINDRAAETLSKIAKIITDYVFKCEKMHFLFVLVDSRLEPQKIDLEFIEQLGMNGVPFGIIFTKADKLSKTQLQRSISTYQQTLLQQWEELPPMFASSSEKGTGRDEIVSYIESILKNFNKDSE